MILPYPVKIFDSVQYQINNHIWIYNTVYASWSPVNNSPCPGLLTWYNRVLIEDRRSLPCVPSRGGCGVPPVFTSCYYSYSLLTKLLRLALWQIDWLLALNISTMNIYWALTAAPASDHKSDILWWDSLLPISHLQETFVFLFFVLI